MIFFQLNQDLYNFFKIPQINQFYEGITLKKLITTGRDGHFSSLKVISRNFHEICTALKKCLVAASIDSEYRAKARGYLASLEQPVNIFLVTFMMDVLSLLNIVNKTFQKSDSDLSSALDILKSVRNQLNELCVKYTVEHITNLVYPDRITSSSDETNLPSKRKRTISTSFQDSIVMERLPCYQEEVNNVEELRAFVIEVVNNLNVEFNHRFYEFNTELWMSFETLKPSTISFLDAQQLKPMLNFIQTIPAVSRKVEDFSFDQLKCECNVLVA